jgi:two-component system sensor histidine kinase KdpD
MTGWIDNAVAGDIARIRAGRAFEVSGVIGSTRTIRVGRSSTYGCTLVDGTGKLELLFLGRAIVDELRTGALCAVSGRAAMRAGRLVAWNPRYRLDSLPSGRHPDQVRPADEAGGLGPTLVQAAMNVAAAAQQACEQAEAAGRFRIYLGAAAGVGKTYAMLGEAQRGRRRGTDVVIAVVESHGRPATEAQAADLEIVPRKIIEHRGARFEELDVEAVLARRPQVALVDELAHSNAPGCRRNEKRWQDVLELLAAGIDVITTVNVQHIESLADVAERISGIRVRERVPDTVIRSADQIELVDSSPQQLRRRMSHGNVYSPERAREALDGFFQAKTLTGLRELALRFMADETTGELSEWQAPGEAAERILVGVTSVPGTDAVLRRAARIAARLKADLQVAHVMPADAGTHDSRVAKLRDLAGDLGARWADIDGGDPATALLDFAQRQQITQVMVGPSRRSRWQKVLSGGSTIRRLSRLADRAGIDLHIIAPPAGPADGGR